MADLGKVLRDEIRRIARIEANAVKSDSQEKFLKLRRQVKDLEIEIMNLKRGIDTVTSAVDEQAISKAQKITGPRFTKRTIISHRRRLGLTIEEFARLLGVNHNSVYNWEHGRTMPRASMLEKIDEVRKLGRRKVNKMLKETGGKDKPKKTKDATEPEATETQQD